MKITIKPTIKQHEAYQALKEKDIIYFGGGAGGGKTWWLCESRLVNSILHPGYKSFFGREELKRLSESTLLTFFKVCAHHKVKPDIHYKYNSQKGYVEFYNGSRIDTLELKFHPSDPLYERFGSLEYTDGSIDEAGESNFMAFDVLKTRIGRHKNKEFGLHPNLAITGNPKKNWTYKNFYKPFKDGLLPNNIAFIQSLYKDNPYIANEYELQLLQIQDKSTKERLMYGNWEYDDDPATLIEYDKIIDMYSNDFIEHGRKCIIADIARYGKDNTLIGLWDGFRLNKIVKISRNKITEAADEINKLRKDNSIPLSNILVDEDGVGGGVVDILGCKGFVNNSRPLNGENYENLKSQCGFKFANRVNENGYYVNGVNEKDKELITEECEQLKKNNIDKDGKQSLVPKDKVKQILGRSPDYSDMLIMREWFELQPKYTGGVRLL